MTSVTCDGTHPDSLSSDHADQFRDAPFDIWGGEGGGLEKNEKKICRHKNPKKKCVANVGRKKKFLVEIDEKYVDQKKHQMVTYIIGKAYDKKFLQRNIKKNCRTLIAKKKIVFSRR